MRILWLAICTVCCFSYTYKSETGGYSIDLPDHIDAKEFGQISCFVNRLDRAFVSWIVVDETTPEEQKEYFDGSLFGEEDASCNVKELCDFAQFFGLEIHDIQVEATSGEGTVASPVKMVCSVIGRDEALDVQFMTFAHNGKMYVLCGIVRSDDEGEFDAIKASFFEQFVE